MIFLYTINFINTVPLIISLYCFCNSFADSINKKTCNNQKELSMRNKSCMKNDISNFKFTNKITIASPKIYPQLSLERNILHTAKTTNISTEVYTIKLFSSY